MKFKQIVSVVCALAAGLLFGWIGAGCQGGGSKAPAASGSRKVAEPLVHHILIEVSDMDRSLAFYEDQLSFKLQSRKGGFAILKGANIGVYLWTQRWDWDKPRGEGERSGLGMYPHIEIDDVPGMVERLRKAGYRIVMDARKFGYGHEAFVADPDGYTWSLISPQSDPAGTRR